MRRGGRGGRGGRRGRRDASRGRTRRSSGSGGSGGKRASSGMRGTNAAVDREEDENAPEDGDALDASEREESLEKSSGWWEKMSWRSWASRRLITWWRRLAVEVGDPEASARRRDISASEREES
ncbi:unnamed protein product [Brassica rapa subsp. narinosa]|nr:unnamed protein product [Brassica napus]